MTYGNDVVLKCFANGGSQPLSYKWAKISGHTYPYRAGSYASQHSFHSELSYQESFHSSMTQGEGNLSEGRVGTSRRSETLGPTGASLGYLWHQVKPGTPVGESPPWACPSSCY